MQPTFLARRAIARLLAVPLAGALMLPLLSAQPAAAQTHSYPTKPVTIVVGYPPGGSTDLSARTVAGELSKALGVSLVVENLSGAAGAIGAQKVINASPDGYTLLVGANSDIAINRLVSRSAKYEVTDFTPLGLIATQPLVLVAAQKTGVKDIGQFLDLLGQNPEKFSYGTSGTLMQMAGEMVKEQAGVSMRHVGYRGAAPLVADLLGNHVDFGVLVLSGALPHIRSGKIVALGTTEEKRSPLTPELPALAEHPALKGFNINAWFALMGPANLPGPVVAKLRDALSASLQTPEARKTLEDAGAVVSTRNVDMPKFLTEEVAKYRRIVDVAKIRTE